MEKERPRVGVGVMIFKEGKVLLSRRIAKHGAGSYAFPGGHLEHLESIEDCAKRETMEEAGIEIDNVRFLCISNVSKYPPKHFINIGVTAEWKSGDPIEGEPEKVTDWQWYSLDALPSPLFDAIPNYIKAYAGESIFYDLKENEG